MHCVQCDRCKEIIVSLEYGKYKCVEINQSLPSNEGTTFQLCNLCAEKLEEWVKTPPGYLKPKA